MTSDAGAAYGERDMGNVEVMNAGGDIIAVARLVAAKPPHGQRGWMGHLTAVAPPTAVEDMGGEVTLRFPDGSQRSVMIEELQTESQLSPGLNVAVVGAEDPWF